MSGNHRCLRALLRALALALLFAALPCTDAFAHCFVGPRFLPATLAWSGPEPQLTPIGWSGSGDVPALTRANAFLVADAERAEWKAGELMPVLLK